MTNFLLKIFIKDKEYKTEIKRRYAYGMLCGYVGIICNLFLFFSKLIVAHFASSVSIAADAFNNLSDFASFIITIIGFKFLIKPADKKHPFGYGRAEYVCSLIVSFLIIILGIESTKTSLTEILEPSFIKINEVTLSFLLLSIAIKFWLSNFFKIIAKKIKSSVIMATSKDSFNDMFSTSSILIGLTITRFFGVSLDGYLGLGVSIFVICSGFFAAKDTVGSILGQAPDEEFVKLIRERLNSKEIILGINRILIHSYGPGRAVISISVNISRDEKLVEAIEKIKKIELELAKEFSFEFVTHIDLVPDKKQ
ncbi:MAG: cation diffusion facilitator family transporter [Oscillospiraceae bacterium]|jgi:cation diffusion facilitator family transporter|nr:cation diffusion facilitator family transporter [Oscillospiraceae bacterium]